MHLVLRVEVHHEPAATRGDLSAGRRDRRTPLSLARPRLGARLPSQALETVTRFRAHDEATLARQHAIHEDEKELLQSALESARQLESLFEADAAEAGKLAPRPGP
jgi:hypothetical protein